MKSDKVLNARISQKLYEKISERAKRNRTTISTLIRHLIEDALEIHEDIHEAVDQKIRKYLSETEKLDILGYQEIKLAKNTGCDNCGRMLNSTETAYFAFFEDRNLKAIFCTVCKTENSKPEEAHENTSNH